MALACISCVIDDSYESSGRNGRNLLMYSENLMNAFVKMPTEELSYLLVLDEFLKLNTEQQSSPEWASFKSGIEFTGNNTMYISSRGIAVNTGGASLKTPGNHWMVISNSTYVHSWSSGDYYNWVGENADNSGQVSYKRISCTEEDCYEITDENGGKESMYLQIEATESSVGGYDFSCSASGSSKENSKGLSSSYEVSDFRYIRQRITEDGTGHSTVIFSYSIDSFKMRVDTYHKGQALDWCELKRTQEGITTVSSNLGYDAYRPYYE